MLASKLKQFLRVKLPRADLAFLLVELADLLQGVCRQLGLNIFRLQEVPPRMRPALGVDDAVDLSGVLLVGRIAIREQYSAKLAKGFLDKPAGSRVREWKDHFLAITVDRPKVTGLHLAPTLTAGLDRGLVHRHDIAADHRIELRFVDWPQQIGHTMSEICQR